MAFSRNQAATIVVDQETEMHVMVSRTEAGADTYQTVPPPPPPVHRALPQRTKTAIHVVEDEDTDAKSLGSGKTSSGAGLNASTTKIANAV
jgi:hypothetical protein